MSIENTPRTTTVQPEQNAPGTGAEDWKDHLQGSRPFQHHQHGNHER